MDGVQTFLYKLFLLLFRSMNDRRRLLLLMRFKIFFVLRLIKSLIRILVRALLQLFILQGGSVGFYFLLGLLLGRFERRSYRRQWLLQNFFELVGLLVLSLFIFFARNLLQVDFIYLFGWSFSQVGHFAADDWKFHIFLLEVQALELIARQSILLILFVVGPLGFIVSRLVVEIELVFPVFVHHIV